MSNNCGWIVGSPPERVNVSIWSWFRNTASTASFTSATLSSKVCWLLAKQAGQAPLQTFEISIAAVPAICVWPAHRPQSSGQPFLGALERVYGA